MPRIFESCWKDNKCALKTIGQEKVSRENAVINVDELLRIKQSPLKCLPVKNLDRQARSIPAEKLTKLDAEDWEKMTMFEKIVLVNHELSVLAKYETDGEYFISEDIETILRDNSNSLQIYMYGKYAKDVDKNPDGSFSLIKPFVILERKSYRVLTIHSKMLGYNNGLPGLCLRFGLSAHESEPGYIDSVNDDDVVAEINEKGVFKGFMKSNYAVSFVNCRLPQKSSALQKVNLHKMPSAATPISGAQ